jgi:signal transduction histidine kinase
LPQEPDRIAPESSQFVSAASLRLRLDWFNKLRWGAVCGALGAVFLAWLERSYSLPLGPLLVVLVILALLNLAYVLRNVSIPPTDIAAEIRVVKLQMVGDLLALTTLIHLTGGIENPLYFIFVIHVIIASLLFKGREIFQIAWLAIILFSGAAAGEYAGWLPHYHLRSASGEAHDLRFLVMTLSSFWLVLLFSAYIGSRIMRHNRTIKDELVSRQQELMVADRAKMDFFRFVTHEVKSPVSTAQSAVETALDLGGSAMSAPVEDMLNRAVGRLVQATSMVQNLADLTRTGAVTQAQMRPVDLVQVIQKIVENQTELAARRDQKIEVDLPADGLEIVTIRPMVEKIASNLISNAVRYNRDGGIVSVRLHDRGHRVRLEVEDEGIGIAPEDQEKVFEEFYRSQDAVEMTNLGTGLGLSIVLKFVKELEGNISLRSTKGAGSKFTVEWPRKRSGSGGGGKVEDQRPAI